MQRKNRYQTGFEIILFGLLGLFIYFLAKLFVLPNLSVFDDQAYIVWDYAAKIGLVPFGDIYYPYGLLEFYKETNLWWQFIYYFYLFILHIVFYVSISKIINEKKFAIFLFILTILYSHLLAGAENFERYGVLLVGTIAIFHALKKISLIKIFSIGIITSFIFVLVNDQGIYLIPIIIAVIVMNTWGNYKSWKKKILVLLKYLISFSAGCVVGLVPYLIYLYSVNALNDFIAYINYLALSTYYAKTPFFPSLKSIENIFVFSILFTSIFYCSYIFFNKKKRGKFFALITLLIIGLLILEYKNITRSNYWQITFFGFFVFFITIYSIFKDVSLSLYGKRLMKSFLIVLSLILLILFSKSSQMKYGNTFPKNNFDKHMNVIGIMRQHGYKGKIYSYPSEPIFYKINNQLPPYYFSLYESTPAISQIKQIDHLIKENIEYVIINSQITGTQDLVPDYLRARIITTYIYNNYIPIFKIGDYIVAKKGSGDFLRELLILRRETYYKHLTKVNLGNIPQGYTNSKEKINIQNWLEIGNSKKVILNKSSKNAKLLINGIDAHEKRIKFNTHDGLSSTVSFSNCLGVCEIDLSWIPLFYRERIIASIEFETSNMDLMFF